jgi:hypothetical protein
MKCKKVVVACINVDSKGRANIGLDGEKYIKEIRRGAGVLGTKYEARKQEVLTLEVFIEAKEAAYDALNEVPLTPQQFAQVEKFAGNSKDAGLYLLAHYVVPSGFAGGAFDATTLAEFVNKLPFTPRKICIVACDAAGEKGDALLPFCKALTKNPRPLVAGYKLPVFISKSKNGKTAAFPEHKNKKRVSTNREAAKAFYQCGGTGWTRIGHSEYHDKAFDFT